jgi:transposase
VRDVPAARPRVHQARRRLGSEAITLLITDYQAGASAAALMKQYGIGKGTVLGILNEAGAIRRRRCLTNEQLAEAAELYRQGWSLVRLGERFGFDQSAVWSALKRQGVTMRRPWEHPPWV